MPKLTVNSLGEILEIYTQKDPRITWQDNDKKGVIPALNKGYSAINGAFITRMDADDIMPAAKLKNLLTTLLNKGPKYIFN